MGFWTSVVSLTKAVIRTGAKVARAAVQTLREVSASALILMGEAGDAILDGAKKVWRVVSPHVNTVRTLLQVTARHAPWPWVASVAHALDITLAALTAFDRSPVARLVEAAVQWMIQKGKDLKQRAERDAFTDVDAKAVAEAETHGNTMRLAMKDAPAEVRQHLKTGAMFADIEVVAGKLNERIKNCEVSETNFDFYLRIRATQKLLLRLVRNVNSAESDAEISEDDHFLAQVARELIKDDPSLTPEDAMRLDAVLLRTTGMRLDAFVLEELVPAFKARWEQLAKDLELLTHSAGEPLARQRVLEQSKAFAFDKRLSDVEQRELDELCESLPALEASLVELREKTSFTLVCAGAAEGLVQMLGQATEDASDEDLEYELEKMRLITGTLTQCYVDPDAWKNLPADVKGRMTRIAHIYWDAMGRRIQNLHT